MLKKRLKGKNYSMRSQRLAFKHKFMLGQFGLSTFYKNHFFLMRSF